MISLSHEEFQKSIVKDGGFESYTQEQFNTWVEDNIEVLQKGERGTLEDFEVPEYDILKAELASFVQIEVINPSQESQFRIEKSIMYVRPKQVEWDEPELIKGEDDTEIMKARSGRYKDTPLNRKLGRVGQKYGGEKKEEDKGEKKPEEKKEQTPKTREQIQKEKDADRNNPDNYHNGKHIDDMTDEEVRQAAREKFSDFYKKLKEEDNKKRSE